MKHTESLDTRVNELFPDKGDAVWALVDEYMAEVAAEEREPVVHAVLTLCGGNQNDLQRLLKVAARDYREVLVMAAEANPPS